MNSRIRDLVNSFFAGLLVVGPILASVGVLLWAFNIVTGWLLPETLASHRLAFVYRLVALILFIAFVVLVGWATRLVIGKQLLIWAEKLIGQVPVLNRTYGFMKEISQTLLSGRKTMFQRVVLVEFPRPGLYSIGFVTNETGGEAQARTKQRVLNVFIPTTPNPTSGFLVLVPDTQVTSLSMSVADGMKMVISGGAVTPPYPAQTATAPVVAVEASNGK